MGLSYQLAFFYGYNEESQKKPIKIFPTAIIKLLDTKTESYTYEDKQVTEHKDSTGKVFATSEAPVTKVGHDTTYNYSICFNKVDLNIGKDFYAVRDRCQFKS